MIFTITSKDNKKIKDVISLYSSKTRKEKGLFIIEGYHLLDMALEANKVVEVYCLKEMHIDRNIPQYIVSEEILKKMSKTMSPQGVIAVCKTLEKKEITGNAIYLDGVNDPGNVGTILRSALAFGFNNVILSNGSCSVYNDKVISGSQGAIFNLNIIEDNNTISELKNKGYEVYSTALRNAIDIKDLKPKSPFVLVFGNEARGVSEEVLNISDKIVKIDMKNMESLNVAIAASISMYLLK